MHEQDGHDEWFSQGVAAYQRGEAFESGPDPAS